MLLLRVSLGCSKQFICVQYSINRVISDKRNALDWLANACC